MRTSDIIHEGNPRFGRWFGEIKHPDPRLYRSSFLSRFRHPLREKRWQYIGLYTEEIIVGCALVHDG